MKPDFERAMQEALQFTRTGRLAEATAAIQGALGRPAPPASAADVIDVQARVVPDAEPRSEDDVGKAQAPRATDAFLAGEFRNDAGARAYKLFVPASSPATGARPPLVVMLHGCTQDPDDFARGTDMNAHARTAGALVLYPAQSRQANPQGCWNWFKHTHQARSRGEPHLLAGMVRAVMAEHDVDPARVYVAGLSAGGAMAAILGATHPDLFAAVGVHSGLAAGAAQDLPTALAAMKSGSARVPPSTSAPPTIVFHGDTDTTVHATNGDRVAEAAGAAGGAVEERGADGGRRWTRRRHADGRVEQWIVHGAGHAWSGGSRAGSYADPAGPDASAQMLRFFLSHARR